MAELLSGRTLILQDGTKVPAEVQLKDKLTLLYFSASWCGPCQRFTPILKNFYENLKASGKNLEVVFISWDETAEDQMEYFRNVHGKWTTMDLETCGNFDKELGDNKFKVDGIPCLKLILPDGTTVLEDATAQLRQPERYCDICRESVGDRWFKCLDCDDYDLCRKCKTHLLLSNEHKFEEKNQTDNKAVEEIWRNWLEKYEKRREKQAMDGGSGARKDATKPEQCCTLDGTCCAE